jgi:hypothetical protein
MRLVQEGRETRIMAENFDKNQLYVSSYIQLLTSLTDADMRIYGDTVRKFIVPIDYYCLYEGGAPSVARIKTMLNNVPYIDMEDIRVICNSNNDMYDFLDWIEDSDYLSYNFIELHCSNCQPKQPDSDVKSHSVLISNHVNNSHIMVYFDNETDAYARIHFDVDNLSWDKKKGFKLVKDGCYVLQSIGTTGMYSYAIRSRIMNCIQWIMVSIIQKCCNPLELTITDIRTRNNVIQSYRQMIDNGYDIKTGLFTRIKDLSKVQEYFDEDASVTNCCVCLEVITGDVLQVCKSVKHLVHTKCIFKWWEGQCESEERDIKSIMACPTCRNIVYL